MEQNKNNHGGKRPGAGRKKSIGKKMIIKIPVLEDIVLAKGGEKKAKQIMLAALLTAPLSE